MCIMLDLMVDFLGKLIIVYIDDMHIFSDTVDHQLRHITAFFNKVKGVQFYPSRKRPKSFAL